jgi:hypothetical protein
MQQLPTAPSLRVQCECVTDLRARELRQHPAAQDVGSGWLKIAQQEHFPDRVLLVSTTSPVSLTFRHEGTGFDHMRASLLASVYACRNPQRLLANEIDVDQTDAISAPTAS